MQTEPGTKMVTPATELSRLLTEHQPHGPHEDEMAMSSFGVSLTPQLLEFGWVRHPRPWFRELDASRSR
jgi:hypothetical protein